MSTKDDERKQTNPGLSAFASLLDPNGTGISKSPVLYEKQDSAEQKDDKPLTSASLAFKPVKRPQIKHPAKPRPGTVISKPPTLYKQDSAPLPTDDNTAVPTIAPADSSPPPAQNANHKPTLQDWMDTMPEDEDAAAAYAAAKQQNRNGGRNARKRKREKEKAARATEEAELTNWKAPYDPSMPNRYQLFKGSDEFYDMVDEWKEFLHSRARATGRARDMGNNSRQAVDAAQRNPAFAPPSEMSFAPPAAYDEDEKPGEDEEPYEPPPPPPPPGMRNDPSGEDAYARRKALADGSQLSPPPASAVNEDEDMDDYEPPPPPPPPSAPSPAAAAPGSISREPVRYEVPPTAPGSISKEPVRYDNSPPSPVDAPMEDAPPADNLPQPSSKRPGQKDFAKRMLAKMGWQEGSGLGAQGTGIATPLSVKLDKRLKRFDAQGGSFIGPVGKGRIMGGKLSKEGKAAEQLAKEEAERIGELSEVVALDHMLDGQDLEEVITELNFYQELGDECGEKYGRVERVYVQRQGDDRGRVFVKFTEKMSAMRALQGYEGREYGGNMIEARYFNPQKFEREVMGM